MPTENRSSNTEMVSVPFQREGRYIVIKLSDLAKVPPAVGKPFAEQLIAIQRRLPERECLVIESDWPEFEPAWTAIEARMTGKPAEQHQGEPVAVVINTNGMRVLSWIGEALPIGAYVFASADPGEVELAGWKERCNRLNDESMAWMRDNDTLRAQLAERDALLRDSYAELLAIKAEIGFRGATLALIGRIDAALSASAEPQVKS